VIAGFERFDGGFDNGIGAVKIGLALPEVDGIVTFGQIVDLGEDGGAETGDTARHSGHDRSLQMDMRKVGQLG
jgi:hypothetical protein